ncbi:MAG: 4-(cytidine 5'-diphospho)-2-C-methyl-D-erythritol kinase, partial [Candidatus Aminicenantes bacterium]|nr:4-(cytidine 5'-diphospho)-2-C-methyl-D-erythritol kinase [Candidatus Aminicenantes bacterium]
GELVVRGDDPEIPWDESNLVHKAARLLRERTGAEAGAAIDVRKRIPSGKGLGGGSADAAMTLYGLNALWGTGFDRPALAELGRELGADVPYFLTGGLCLGRERGDVVEALPDLPLLPVVLALPPFRVLTADIYRAFPAALTSEGRDSKIVRFFEAQDKDFGRLENGLETVIFRSYPELADLKSLLRDRGATLSLVSGSGSAVYGLFQDRERAEVALDAVRTRGPAILVETLSRDRYWESLCAGV